MNSNPSRGKPQARKLLTPRRPPEENEAQPHGATSPNADAGPHVSFPPILETELPADIVLARLQELRLRIQGSGSTWHACCPAHLDSEPSLSLTETAEGVLLVHCFAGCETATVLAKLGLTLRDLYPSLYALQFGKRRPLAALRFRGGESREHAAVVEPTDEDCAAWSRLLKSWPLPDYALNQVAVHLGLPREALQRLEVGYNEEDSQEPCWVFPERDDRRRVVGLLRRYDSGRKRALTGSVRGLTIPRYGKTVPPGPIYLVEGASDTAALVSVGAFALGRSNATGNPAEQLWLTRRLGRYPERDIIVVGERDASGVGKSGAAQLAHFLHETLDRPVRWVLPRQRYKDSREQIVAGKWPQGFNIQEILQ